ncbi:MAG: hypothetical protein H7838_11370 [Magnetococcus sp. DMHC-8]
MAWADHPFSVVGAENRHENHKQNHPLAKKMVAPAKKSQALTLTSDKLNKGFLLFCLVRVKKWPDVEKSAQVRQYDTDKKIKGGFLQIFARPAGSPGKMKKTAQVWQGRTDKKIKGILKSGIESVEQAGHVFSQAGWKTEGTCSKINEMCSLTFWQESG